MPSSTLLAVSSVSSLNRCDEVRGGSVYVLAVFHTKAEQLLAVGASLSYDGVCTVVALFTSSTQNAFASTRRPTASSGSARSNRG